MQNKFLQSKNILIHTIEQNNSKKKQVIAKRDPAFILIAIFCNEIIQLS